jgi:hypothetical protein
MKRYSRGMLAWMLLLVMVEKEEEKYSTQQNMICFSDLMNSSLLCAWLRDTA